MSGFLLNPRNGLGDSERPVQEQWHWEKIPSDIIL
jgi:hypothetical protein